MSVSQKFSLSKPVEGQAILVPTLAYMRARHRRKLHSLVLAEFRKSGLSQAELCRRLRKEPAQISRMLGTPGNWSLDSVSDLLFAISASELTYQLAYPLEKAARNFRAHEQFFSIKSATSNSEAEVKEIKEIKDDSSGFKFTAEAA